MHCPKCGHEQVALREDCSRCGIVFANFDAAAAAQAQAALEQRRSNKSAAAQDSRRIFYALGALIAAALGGLAWQQWPSPYRADPPLRTSALGTEVRQHGRARNHAWGERDLFLVGLTTQTPLPIGHISADGAFDFTLPAEMTLERYVPKPLPEESKARLDPAMRARFEEHERAGERAAGAWGLGVEMWQSVQVEPVDLNVARFGVVIAQAAHYADPTQRGDLLLSNKEIGTAAAPGDVIVTWLWADRDGRVSGDAVYEHPLAGEVLQHWDLELHRGWNLVQQVQQEGAFASAWRTASLPRQLEWNSIDVKTLPKWPL